MKPLRVEFNLTTPVAGMALPPHLDALLAFAVTEEALRGARSVQLNKMSIRSIGENLPLKKETQGDLWCWQASALMADEVLSHQLRMWTRKTESELIATMTQDKTLYRRCEPKFPLAPFELKVDTSSGDLKNHFQFTPSRLVNKFTAFCVGNEDRIYDLLQTYITHIGAKGGSGYGSTKKIGAEIQDIHVTEDDAALVMWQRRALPWPKEGFLPMQAAHKAPYWATENRTISYLPEDIMV